jgi:WD40 repeat protein
MDDVLISGSFDETLKFWNLNTGECLETLKTPQLYERMNILGVQGLTDAQKMTLQALGAIEISIAPASLVSVSEYRQNGQRLGNLPLKYSVKSQ